MKIENIKIVDLKQYKLNAKQHPETQIKGIAESIKMAGFIQPIVVDKKNEIIIGHGRLAAAHLLNMTEVPCVRVEHLNKDQIRALRLIDNRIAETGWDNSLLIEDLADLDFNFADFNIDFDFIGNDILKNAEVEGEDDVPEVVENPITKTGDVWLLGDHRLMCGDSTNIDAVNKLVNGRLIDMFLTDPPYNVAYEGKTKDALKIKNDSMADDKFRKFLRDAFTAADTVMKPGAVFYIWHADLEGYNFRGACADASWKVRQCLIWKKSSIVMGRQDYHWKHEPCLYGWKEGAGHLWATDRKQTTILEFDKPSRNGEHPTMKPVALFEYQMLNNTKSGDVVLDLFGGSGTTVIAAHKNGRMAYIMELDPIYCDVIVKRWEEFTNEKAKLEVKN